MRSCSKYCGDKSPKYLNQIDEREIFYLREYLFWSLSKIAKALSCSISTVDRRLAFMSAPRSLADWEAERFAKKWMD